ncbi:diguanylate cyclase [bacterium]|nr:diguanylate cyclase [bacterium]
MTENRNALSLKYRLIFYICGFSFATLSYILGVWAYGVESADWGYPEVYRILLNNLQINFQSHYLTFFSWQIICISIAGIIGHLFDMEVYHRLKAEQRANIDGLTDIYNHRYFQERLANEIERANRYSRPLCLIMLDLDNFKIFNDTWGHQEGDKLLKWFADICAGCIRNIDILARYGGEEFVIILPETEAQEALEVAERIRHTVSRRSKGTFGNNKRTTVSAGIAGFPSQGQTPHQLVLNADAALYYAKQQGKNRCFVYREEFHCSYRANPGHVKPLLDDDDISAIEALAAMADAKDSHSRGHSLSVMSLSVTLAESIGMSAEEINNLKIAALLHDIGRIATPEKILEKSEPLEADEWQQIENQPKLGSCILKRMQQMSSIVPAVKHHHERYDGKGYPAKLAGKNIPLLARIIAITEAFDAMTSNRSYRKALTVDEAVNELKTCAGTQFDPDLVKLFVETIEKRGYKKEAA